LISRACSEGGTQFLKEPSTEIMPFHCQGSILGFSGSLAIMTVFHCFRSMTLRRTLSRALPFALPENETNQELKNLMSILAGKGPGPVKFLNAVAIAYFKSLENYFMPGSQYHLTGEEE